MLQYDKLRDPLSIDDIEFRIQSVNKAGYATILAYKNARVDMHILDLIVGPENWQRRHEFKNGQSYCSVGIYDEEKKEWVWKEDVGTVSISEAEKGQASDSFKRACFNWGIGRELYAYPRISISLGKNQKEDIYGEWYTPEPDKKNPYPKPRAGYGLKLNLWNWHSEFKDGKITFLYVKDEKGVLRFSFGQPCKPEIYKLKSEEMKSLELHLKTLTTINQINNAYTQIEQRSEGQEIGKEIKDLFQNITDELKEFLNSEE